jgi:hypothetical protein
MRQQRAIVVASIGFTAALAGAVPVALMALGDTLTPVPLPAPPAIAKTAPMALPAAPPPAPIVRQPRHATRVRAHTIIPVARQLGETIIPAPRAVPASHAPMISTGPRRAMTPKVAPAVRGRNTATRYRRYPHRMIRTTHRTPHLPPVQRSTPAPAQATASTAAIPVTIDAKAIRKALKHMQKVHKQVEKAMRNASERHPGPHEYTVDASG